MTTRKTIFVVQFLSHVQVFVTPWFSEYSGLISLTIDWFDLLAVQGTLRSLFQHHSLKASIPWRKYVKLKKKAYYLFKIHCVHVLVIQSCPTLLQPRGL